MGGTFSDPGTPVVSYDTTAFSNSDPLQIWVDVDLPQEVSLVRDDSTSAIAVDVSDIYVRALLKIDAVEIQQFFRFASEH